MKERKSPGPERKKWKGIFKRNRSRSPVGRSRWAKQKRLSSSSIPSPQSQTSPVQNQAGERPGTPWCVSEQDITNCQWFHYGAHIGNETRKIEFKQGHGKEDFHRQVRIYGCAFLNSGGGSLLVGVKDNGVVCGVKFSHKMEDETRLQVDRIMKQFVPPLLPNNCSLHFLPVVKPQEEGHQLKVLRLTFRPPTFSEPTLFQVGQGEVYVRWDGSVQGPLGASVILEWARQMWTYKLQQLEQAMHKVQSMNWFLAGQVQELLPSICPTPSQYFQTCFENPRPRSQASSQHQIPGSGTRFPSPSQM